MAQKRKSYEKKSFESTGVSSDTYAGIYMSMVMHPAWQDLTPNQQRLYLYCKLQYYGEKRKPKTGDYPDGHAEFFTMNRSKWCNLYKLYSSGNKEGFYRDRDALIKHGFIKCIENGMRPNAKTIYKYSDMWKKWGTPDFYISTKDMSRSMVNEHKKRLNDTS